MDNDSGLPYRGKDNIVETMILPLDDIGTKCKAPPLEPSMVVETRPGNYTYIYRLSKPATPKQHRVIMATLIKAEYCDPNCGEPERLVRLPDSQPFDKEHKSALTVWNPDVAYDPDTFLDLLELEEVEVSDVGGSAARKPAPPGVVVDDEVLTWLDERGMLRREGNDGFFEIECPWKDECHTEKGKDIAKYKPATEDDIRRVYYCFHTHGQEDGPWGCAHKTSAFLDWVKSEGGPDVGVEYPVDRSLGDLEEYVEPSGEWDAGEGKEPASKFDGGIFSEIAERLKGKDETNLPDPKYTAKGMLSETQNASPVNIEWLLEKMGATRMFNMMTQSLEWRFDDILGDLLNGVEENVVMGAIKQFGSQCKMSMMAVENTVQNVPAVQYHPMDDWLAGLDAWDGHDYIGDLASSLPVKEGYEDYTQVVVRKWLIQAVQAVRGWKGAAKQIPHVLVLCGPQGVGKTTWITGVAPSQFTGEGATLHLSGSVSQTRDSARAATRRAIVELGELETTFGKSEQGALKNFLSTTEDTYRPAYGRYEITTRRCTVFAASVNTSDILRDPTGSRRYWPIDLEGEQIPPVRNVEGIWAQANHLWESGATWFLEGDEKDLHDRIAENHTDTPEVFELMDEKYPNGFMAKGPGGAGSDLPEGCRVLSVTQIQKEIDVRSVHTRSQIRAYVEQHGGVWGKYTDSSGKRIKNACIAKPTDDRQLKALQRAMLSVVE
jgi:putative DNA primase/helicase